MPFGFKIKCLEAQKIPNLQFERFKKGGHFS